MPTLSFERSSDTRPARDSRRSPSRPAYSAVSGAITGSRALHASSSKSPSSIQAIWIASRIFSPQRCGSSSNPGSSSTHCLMSVNSTRDGSTPGCASASAIAISRLSVHFTGAAPRGGRSRSLCLLGVVYRVLGNLDHQLRVADLGLAGKAGHGRQAPGTVEQVVFVLRRGREGVEAFADDHVTSRAGAGLLARVLDRDPVIEQIVADRFARRGIEGLAVGTKLRVREDDQLRHGPPA